MHILICDDDLILAERLKQFAERFCREHALNASISVCDSEQACMRLFDEGVVPTLLLLDIYLQNENGFDVAQHIRDRFPRVEIAFVTAYAQHMPDAFAFRPIGFLLKPFSYEQAEEILNRFLHYARVEKQFFSVVLRDQAVVLPYEQIAYFESNYRTITCFQTSGAQLSFVGKLDDVQPQLDREIFLRCHKSYLVNLRQVQSLDRSAHTFILKNGSVIPVSRSIYQECAAAFVRYMTL